MADETVNTDAKGENDKDQTKTDHASETAENMIPKTRFDQVNQQKREAIDALKSVANELAQDVPEDMRDIIPDLGPAERIKWIRQASKKGIFTKQPASGLDSTRPGNSKPMDLENMSNMEMMSRGYK